MVHKKQGKEAEDGWGNRGQTRICPQPVREMVSAASRRTQDADRTMLAGNPCPRGGHHVAPVALRKQRPQ